MGKKIKTNQFLSSNDRNVTSQSFNKITTIKSIKRNDIYDANVIAMRESESVISVILLLHLSAMLMG